MVAAAEEEVDYSSRGFSIETLAFHGGGGGSGAHEEAMLQLHGDVVPDDAVGDCSRHRRSNLHHISLEVAGVASIRLISCMEEFTSSSPSDSVVMAECQLPATTTHDADADADYRRDDAARGHHHRRRVSESEVRAMVSEEVASILGYSVHSDDPLMSSGLNSQAGMELRGTLSEVFDQRLPATLLYDYQSIGEIAKFVCEELAAASSVQVGEEEEKAGVAGGDGGGGGGGDASSSSSLPASLRTLRGAAVRPLFLAAPGVANGQSAYFSFISHLSWSDQPIYTLEKDDSKNISELAAVHVKDILRVQPRGPYLIGGHSYGGVVAMEVALQLERRGEQVGHVFVFDAPHPLQVRGVAVAAAEEEEEEATDEDAFELMEMILAAIDFGAC